MSTITNLSFRSLFASEASQPTQSSIGHLVYYPASARRYDTYRNVSAKTWALHRRLRVTAIRVEHARNNKLLAPNISCAKEEVHIDNPFPIQGIHSFQQLRLICLRSTDSTLHTILQQAAHSGSDRSYPSRNLFSQSAAVSHLVGTFSFCSHKLQVSTDGRKE